MLNLQYCSDLHLEFPENKSFLEAHPIQPVGDLLVLSGDIIPFSEMHKFDSFFDELSEKFKQVYWIPGNHEYYHTSIDQRTGAFCEEVRKNIFLINNFATKIEGVKLIFSTLWTKISKNKQWNIQQRMNDFHVIKQGKALFSPTRYNELYHENLEFIQKSVSETEPNEQVVVVTHHVPTFLNYPEQYKGDVLNEAFAVELFDFIESSPIDCWIYGHHHSNILPFNIGSTQLLTNQLGYVRYGEHLGFSFGECVVF